MAKCPKCGRKLRITDVSQFCPGCSVNMRFYNFEENFVREAKMAELSQAGLKVKLRNLKYSFSGSRLVTAKLIVMLLPVLSLLIPSGNIAISLPFVSSKAHFGILGIVNIVTGGSLNYIFEMCSSAVEGEAFSALRNALFGFVATALFAVFCLLFSLFGFISIKNMQKITTVTAGLGIIASAVTLVLIGIFNSSAASSLILSGSFGFGLFVTTLMFCCVFTVNLLLWKKGIHPVYDEGVEERVRIYKEVKAGRINIDDLPQPVVETEATRRIDEEIAKEELAFYEKFKGEVSADG
ncbi:MAG: hypothetical protein J6A97_08990 [Clostridia bacterium]|nr:hypothetical protein [Clostridia bacterium]